MKFIDIFQLDNNYTASFLIQRLHAATGCVYLHDIEGAVIGIYPKTLFYGAFAQQHWVKYQRNEWNFGYDLVTLANRQALFADIPAISPCDAVTEHGFSGGWMGFIGYDAAASHQGIDTPDPSDLQGVDVLWGEYDIYLRQLADGWHLYVAQAWLTSVDGLPHVALQSLIDCLAQPTDHTVDKLHLSTPLQPMWSQERYARAFAQVQTYLYAGDAYQVNLTQSFRATIAQGALYSLCDELWRLTRAPFAGYMAFKGIHSNPTNSESNSATPVFELLSCSPELFIAFEGQRRLVTRPIKGTLPRLADATSDAAQRQRLADSTKDQAENLMIVDLLRNDLSKYAEVGSVHVPHLFEIESFAQVHHMVSEIEATLRPDVNVFEVLLDSLPGGSISGAPKIRAMQIIAELEQRPRGAYCGSMGYLNYDGSGRFNILIRTLQRCGDQLELAAGGGITVASSEAAEYQESLDKVAAILHCLNAYAPASSAPSTPESAVHADGQSPL